MAAKDFERIDDKKTVVELLSRAAVARETVDCRIRESGERFQAKVVAAMVGTLQLEVDHATGASALAGLKKSLNENEDQLSRINIMMRLQGALYFTEGQVRSCSGLRVHLALEPPTLFKLQRRAHLRFAIGPYQKCTALFDGKARTPIDVSVGGLALAVNEEELSQYPAGREFPMVFSLGPAREEVLVQVTAVTPIKRKATRGLPQPAQQWKVGLRFLSLPPALEAAIAQEAYFHAMKAQKPETRR